MLLSDHARKPSALDRKRKKNTTMLFLFAGIVVFLIVIPYFLQKNLNLHPYGMNDINKYDFSYESIVKEKAKTSWPDLTTFYWRRVLQSTVPYKQKEDGCINRSTYFFEMARLLDLDPYNMDFSLGYTFVFGKDTPVGSHLMESLKDKGIGINCQNYFDFDNDESMRIMGLLNITSAFYTCRQMHPKNASLKVQTNARNKELKYLTSVLKIFKALNKPITFVHSLPHDKGFLNMAREYNAKIFIVPELLDDLGVYGNSVQECLQYGFSTIEIAAFNSPSQYTAQQVAEYLLKNDLLNQITYLGESSNYKPPFVAKESIRHIYPCNQTIINSERTSFSNFEGTKINLKNPSNAVPRFIRTLRAIKRMPTDVPYLSIIVPVIDTTESSFKRFISSIDEGLRLYPLANIELIILECGKPIHQVVSFSPYMKRFTRIYLVAKPEKECNLNAVIRNAGFELSSGEFCLFIEPNTIFSPSIFQLIGQKSFNKGIFYTSPVYSGMFDILDSFNKAVLDDDESALEIGLSSVVNSTNGLVFVNDLEKLMLIQNTSISIFLLVSKDLLRATGKFPQDSKSKLKDIMIQTMHILPGTALMSIPYGVALEGSINPQDKYSNFDEIKASACTGDTPNIYKSKATSIRPITKLIKAF